MARQRAARLWACLALVASLCGNALAVGPSYDVAYCATVNTADPGMDANESDYQSMGLCYGTCSSAEEKYAFAVVWQKSCWCTNVVPNSANTVSSEQCSNPCPGYPSDWCGGDSLYGYLKITGIKPSSTAAAASSTSTGTTTQQATKTTASSTKPTTQPTTTAVVIIKTETEQTAAIKTVQSTVRETVTVIPSLKSSVASSTVVSYPTTLVTSATQTTDDPVTTDPMQPSTQTVTVGGKVQTVIITPTPTATSAGQLAEPEANGKKKAISTGAAVGIAIGVVAALGIIGVLLWIWFMKRRKQNEESGSSFGSPRGSSSGSKSATVTETRFAPELVAWGDGPASKRRSTLMPVDPRLNPYGSALYNGQNKSRESITSFQDNQDYSRRVVGQPRVLRAVNPDPIAED
ncbi:hypothetical protein NEUTE1DRAFT_121482 [Neurospora tetrasperma FGSC 2508]|uniref:WSC domain-containing protein n=1 Tax=Neurospora tetrasperma (strain FGSC 2508 / ATCC MYA-4615 / P0657) TaxID=510951 RepID=F8MI25_NEUT8|nr:uncharacterized protein NEUTE1DRAFT_121482 [Neurospora tetrasperma FGSC 2508]EGO59733.1 hypothetical protein NEUTE1DRAFT_121482 [Neurospora tetrasperma FGSC 2508]EGZ73875.1 WSC-domain-containing protein [Neurospora tetrasperma FGSC 2509]